jgi:hypothetical protein
MAKDPDTLPSVSGAIPPPAARRRARALKARAGSLVSGTGSDPLGFAAATRTYERGHVDPINAPITCRSMRSVAQNTDASRASGVMSGSL